jgi:asparagine synthase (glutamine-hydrolysing)
MKRQMCGLSAIIDFEPNERLLQPLLAMHECIRHRGPDGEGFMVIDAAWHAIGARTAPELERSAMANLRVGTAFRWLRIQDPGEAAAQPMSSSDGSVWLMFNGEIYNFREIRRELEQLGYRSVSVGDTEVILAAYLQWGAGCFGRLNGMWAMILVDLRDRKILISRDRFGIKPLFYYRDQNRILIASEVKQLLAAGAPAIANRSALARFIRGLRPATPEETFFRDIFAQPAATFAEIRLQDPTALCFEPYWRLDPVPTAPAPPLEEACAILNDLLAESVSEHMVAQARIGHLISGGLDSSLLAALAAPIYARRGERGMAASMAMTSAKAYDESSYIDQVVAALHLQSVRAELTSVWLKNNIDRVTRAQEEPVAGMAVAGQFLAYEAAAHHGARVVLDGQGADEIFAGYPRHQYTVLKDYLRRGALTALLRELGSLWRHDARFLRDTWRLRVIPRLAHGWGRHPRQPASGFLRTTDIQSPAQCRAPPQQRFSALDAELLNDVLAGNLRPALAVTDRNSMAHSIEARVPYVDQRIIEFAFQLPDHFKIGGGKRKRILRLLAERYLPKAIVGRVDRIGFGVPIEQWLTTNFRSELAALPDSEIFKCSTLFDQSRLRSYIEGYLAGRHHDSGTVWRLYALEVWARVHAVSAD